MPSVYPRRDAPLLPRGDDAVAADLDRVVRYLGRPPVATGLDVAAHASTGAGSETGRVGQTFGDLVDKVDFPAFVGGLVKGVFNSVVQSSIKQMQAYEDMIKSVAKSADTYANEQIPESAARNYLVSQVPGQLQMGPDGRLVRAPGATDDGLKAKLGYVPDLTSAQNEAVLVSKAKVRLAEQKQKMLATLVLMGINRIVVTDGQINATVNFDVKAQNSASRKASSTDSTTARDKSMQTESDTSTLTGGGKDAKSGDHVGSQDYDYDGIIKSVTDAASRSNSKIQVSTLTSKDTSGSTDLLKAQAQLSGRVKINFKSETFPLDKMSPSQLTRIMGVQGAGRGTPSSASTGGAEGSDV